MSWIEMRGCLDTGTRPQASQHAFSRLYNNTDTCMAACVRGSVGARFQKGKILTPCQGFLPLWVLSTLHTAGQRPQPPPLRDKRHCPQHQANE